MDVRFNEAASTTPIPIKTAGMAFLKLVFFFWYSESVTTSFFDSRFFISSFCPNTSNISPSINFTDDNLSSIISPR